MTSVNALAYATVVLRFDDCHQDLILTRELYTPD